MTGLFASYYSLSEIYSRFWQHILIFSILGLGFIEKTDYSKLSLGPGHDKPYQFDPTVREPKSIDLYKYLNLKSCLWQFDAYYHLNELIDFCNGKAANDFEVRASEYCSSFYNTSRTCYDWFMFILHSRLSDGGAFILNESSSSALELIVFQGFRLTFDFFPRKFAACLKPPSRDNRNQRSFPKISEIWKHWSTVSIVR